MTPPDFDDALLERLFTTPTLPPSLTRPESALSERITLESTAEIRRLMIECHKRFHPFYRNKRREYHNHLLHNHLLHHLLVAYVLGYPPEALRATFSHYPPLLNPAYKSPRPITQSNWKEHLGNQDYYNAYVNFFATEAETRSLSDLFTHYVLAPEANWGVNEPRMLDRFLAGLIHPLIHFAHGVEYGVKGIAIEGLAWTVVQRVENRNVFDEQFFVSPQPAQHTHALSILAKILADSRLEAGNACSRGSFDKYQDTEERVGPIIREYALQWTVGEDEQEIQERMEELTWCTTVIFGVGGFKHGKVFKADPFTVHLVTTNHFLRCIVPLLSPPYQVNFLRAYFAVVLVYFVCRGRPALDFRNFFQSPISTSWDELISWAIPKDDAHYIKAARALVQNEEMYSHRPKATFKDIGLEGVEEMDGSLFVRTGTMLASVSNWEMCWRRPESVQYSAGQSVQALRVAGSTFSFDGSRQMQGADATGHGMRKAVM